MLFLQSFLVLLSIVTHFIIWGEHYFSLVLVSGALENFVSGPLFWLKLIDILRINKHTGQKELVVKISTRSG